MQSLCEYLIEWKLLIFHFRSRDRRIEKFTVNLGYREPCLKKTTKTTYFKAEKKNEIYTFLCFKDLYWAFLIPSLGSI